MSNNVERPKVSYRGRKLGELFPDLDGSIWQLQADFQTNMIIPVKVLDAPKPMKMHTSQCSKPNVRLKF